MCQVALLVAYVFTVQYCAPAHTTAAAAIAGAVAVLDAVWLFGVRLRDPCPLSEVAESR